MNYSNEEYMVRMDRFKPSGKWYDTFSVSMKDYYTHPLLNVAVKEAFLSYISKHIPTTVEEWLENHKDWKIVCLEPYHESAYPVMVII